MSVSTFAGTAARDATSASRTEATGLVGAVRAKLARWREMARIYDELGQLSARELADLGLSRSDIPAVAHGTYCR